MKLPSLRRLLAASIVAVFLVPGCVEQSSTVVSFDVILESATIKNELLAPIVVFRDGVILDTLPASQERSYPIGHRGPVRHAWQLLSPRDRFGKKVGVEPYVDLGIQYPLNAQYTVDNESLNGSVIDQQELFTPLIANYSPEDLRLIVNYREEAQVYTDMVIPRGTALSLDNAPYFYWHSSSNVRLESMTSSRFYFFTRDDTAEARRLELNTSNEFEGQGRTLLLVAE
jgi:hypothetical protein